ncbi:uncharacterized protein LOC144747066 [Ciona intestinalis]
MERNDTDSKTYKEKRMRLSKCWRELEPKLLLIQRELYRFGCSRCVACKTDVEQIIRCRDCGCNQYYCLKCWQSYHTYIWFHIPEIWNGEYFETFQLPPRVLKRTDEHVCDHVYTNPLSVIDYKGRTHCVEFEFCGCESEAETITRSNLWPCSPTAPKIAVSISLLEWIRVLCMEKQVSVESFCNALYHRHSSSLGDGNQVKNLSKILLQEVMESYRHHVYQMQHLQDLLPDMTTLDDGSKCPACNGGETVKTYSFDANFGLVRRLAAGEQSSSPHHLGRFFAPQEEVDEFVNNYDDSKVSTIDCSNFQAGSLIRSKGKNNKLSEKGVFGACCKHEFPKMFVNLKHGERVAYPTWFLKRLLQDNSSLRIFYDIACRLKEHLKKRNEDAILACVNFAVPVFHGYGHKTLCQLEFSPRRLKGFGLTEGETMERLWSFLRNFNKISKEMKPEHRTDLLTDALIYYGQRLKHKFGSFLCFKLHRATCRYEQSKKELCDFVLAYPGEKITVAQLSEWSSSSQFDSPNIDEILIWKEEYALLLHDLCIKRNNLDKMEQLLEDHEAATEYGEIAKLDKQLMQIESSKGISNRWSTSSNEFHAALTSAADKKRYNMLIKFDKLCMEKQFLSSLIKKYAVGQSVVEKLLSSLKRVTAKMRKLIADYNSYSSYPTATYQKNLSMDTERQVRSGFENSGQATIQKMLDCFNLMQRSVEEQRETKKDMLNILQFYQGQINIVEQLYQQTDEMMKPYVLNHQLQLEIYLKQTWIKFKEHINFLPRTPLITKNSHVDFVCDQIEVDEDEVAEALDSVTNENDNESDDDDECE